MVHLTKEQQLTLLRKWHESKDERYSFLKFRRMVLPTIGCNDAVTVPWCGMLLCIETNGYCHT